MFLKISKFIARMATCSLKYLNILPEWLRVPFKGTRSHSCNIFRCFEYIKTLVSFSRIETGRYWRARTEKNQRLCYIRKFPVDVAVLLPEVIVVILFLFVRCLLLFLLFVGEGGVSVLCCSMARCGISGSSAILLNGGEILFVPNMLIYSIKKLMHVQF